MQPLSRVKADAKLGFDQDDTMSTRPKIAVKIAECISEWADIESMLGIYLALLLDTDRQAALAMFSALDNRAGSLRMLEAATKTKLPEAHAEIFSALLLGFIRPAMRERDKLAHWCWGQSPDLPDSLLLMEPTDKIYVHMQAIRPPKPVEFDRSKVFVVTEVDLERTLQRFRTTENHVAHFMGTVWLSNPPELRDSLLQSLSKKPPIVEAVARLRKNQKNNPEFPELSPPPTLSG